MSASPLPWEGRRRVLRGLAGVGIAVGYVPLAWSLPGRRPDEGLAAAGPAGPNRSLEPDRSLESDRSAGSGPAAGSAILSLVAGSALDAAFLAGVHRAATARGAGHAAGHPAGHPLAHRIDGFDAAFFLQLEALLRDDRETRLLGLLDDATATLVIDLVRSAGGRILVETRHRTGADAPALAWATATGQALALEQDAPRAPDVFSDGVARAHVSLCCLI